MKGQPCDQQSQNKDGEPCVAEYPLTPSQSLRPHLPCFPPPPIFRTRPVYLDLFDLFDKENYLDILIGIFLFS